MRRSWVSKSLILGLILLCLRTFPAAKAEDEAVANLDTPVGVFLKGTACGTTGKTLPTFTGEFHTVLTETGNPSEIVAEGTVEGLVATFVVAGTWHGTVSLKVFGKTVKSFPACGTLSGQRFRKRFTGLWKGIVKVNPKYEDPVVRGAFRGSFGDGLFEGNWLSSRPELLPPPG